MIMTKDGTKRYQNFNEMVTNDYGADEGNKMIRKGRSWKQRYPKWYD